MPQNVCWNSATIKCLYVYVDNAAWMSGNTQRQRVETVCVYVIELTGTCRQQPQTISFKYYGNYKHEHVRTGRYICARTIYIYIYAYILPEKWKNYNAFINAYMKIKCFSIMCTGQYYNHWICLDYFDMCVSASVCVWFVYDAYAVYIGIRNIYCRH